jgi:hypothetical protein
MPKHIMEKGMTTIIYSVPIDGGRLPYRSSVWYLVIRIQTISPFWYIIKKVDDR